MHAFKRLSVSFLVTCAFLLVSACADYNWKIPGVYRIPVQQGAVLEQSMFNQLKPGMNKDQVRYIMGSPVIADPFHSNRWEYLYSFQSGSDKVREQRHVTLYFDDEERLARVDGDVVIGDPELRTDIDTADNKQAETYVVPERSKPGFFARLFSGDPGTDGGARERQEESVQMPTGGGQQPAPGGGQPAPGGGT